MRLGDIDHYSQIVTKNKGKCRVNYIQTRKMSLKVTGQDISKLMSMYNVNVQT